MERNRARSTFENNQSRGRGSRFRNQNGDQLIHDNDQISGFQRNSFNRRPSSSYPNRGAQPSSSYPNRGAQHSFVDNQNKYRGQRQGKMDSSTSRENTLDRNPESPRVRSVNLDAVGDDETHIPFLSGTCPDMCPAKERAQRERLRDLAVFERLNGNPQKTAPDLALKKFCRTLCISDIQMSDIRPLPVLCKTMKYLLELVDTSEHAFETVHDFVFDRTRAIRQELRMQNITSHQAIIMHEQMVRFHILSQHKLHQLSSNKDTSMLHLNFEQLSKCLRSLLDLYNFNMKSTFATGCQAEFYCYHVLMNMKSQSLPQGESLSVWFQTVRPSLLKSKEMKFARNVLRCYRLGNFKSFFNLAKESTYLEACLMEHYFNDVRAQAVASINQSCYKLSPFPLVDLAKLLMMTESDMEDFCNLCGLGTSTDDKGLKFLTVKQFNFCLPEKGFPWYSCPLIEEKQLSSYSSEITKKLNLW